jgi:hypothetical protein
MSLLYRKRKANEEEKNSKQEGEREKREKGRKEGYRKKLFFFFERGPRTGAWMPCAPIATIASIEGTPRLR